MKFKIELIDYRSLSEPFYIKQNADELEPVYRLYKKDYDIFGEWKPVVSSNDLEILKSIAQDWKKFKTIYL